MTVSYNKLWKLLVDKKMNKDEEAALTVLSKICKNLDCDYGDIILSVPDTDNE